jgi:hypothetical protein
VVEGIREQLIYIFAPPFLLRFESGIAAHTGTTIEKGKVANAKIRIEHKNTALLRKTSELGRKKVFFREHDHDLGITTMIPRITIMICGSRRRSSIVQAANRTGIRSEFH